jgi:hypothetical protein
MVQKVQGKFNTFKSSIPLHFDMLNATPYSLSKEGNLNVERMNGFNSSKKVQNVQKCSNVQAPEILVFY